jgi:hypothetical protein
VADNYFSLSCIQNRKTRLKMAKIKDHKYSKEERSSYFGFRNRVGLCKSIEKPTVYINPYKELPIFTHVEVYCSTFGCGKVLTPMETRYGNKCLNCMGKHKIDPTKFIKL